MSRLESGGLRIILAAGGTGGHLWPALSLALALKRARPETECLFVGTGRPVEDKILEPFGFRRAVLKTSGWQGLGPAGRIKALWRCLTACGEAARLIRSFRPRVCFGAGGYVTVPVGLAARLLGVPLAVHEQNARAGLSNRLLGRLADRVMLGFGEAAAAFPAGRTVVTGNPVRPEIAALHRLERSFDRRPLTVLVTGGSQGARSLNLAAAPALAALGRARPLRIVHQAGADSLEEVRAIYRTAAIEAEAEDFFQDMAAQYRRADLVVARAGAITVSELSAARLPAVLAPLPTAAKDHQRLNARLLEAAGAAVVLARSGLTADALYEVLSDLLERPERLEAMSRAAAGLATRLDAAERMAGICLELAGVNGRPAPGK